MSKQLVLTKSFKKDIKKHYLHLATPEWADVLSQLLAGLPLPRKYLDHQLTGNQQDFRDCHVKNDLVLIYETDETRVILHRLNTHSELFKD